ncbi:acyltransferase family protein [Paramagnetospirillum magneticum]|nr:acyltransferase [Paramagnetospirillum magneticum]
MIRLLLAICVVAGHSRGFFGAPLMGGGTAVQIFYVISGFYITLVLNEKYRERVRLFYSNRLLRLVPSYMIVLLLAVIALAVFGRSTHASVDEWRAMFGQADLFATLYYIWVNIGMLGSDQALFTYLTPDGSLGWTADFRPHALASYRFLLVPQSWSIGVELLFYAVAPFVVTRSPRLIIGLMVVSYAARWSAYANGFAFDPWTYRFFPFELGTFFAGALAARFRQGLERNGGWLLLAVWVATIGTYAATATVTMVGPVMDIVIRETALTWGMAFSLPAIYALSKSNGVDRFAGALSYPLYICHHFVILAVAATSGADGLGGVKSMTVLAIALAVSVVLAVFVEIPVDRWRQNRALGNPEMKA